MSAPQRPYVICHMTPSVDGRIVVDDWALTAHRPYERIAKTFGADAWIVGRTSMQPFGSARTRVGKLKARKRREDFCASTLADSYAIAIDPSGKLTWKSGMLDDEQLVMVLTESVDDAHLAKLRDVGVSYVFAGKSDIDCKLALRKLRTLFGIEKLLLEGGGNINGHFLAAGAIDELSLVVAPIADGDVGMPTLFDRPAKRRGKAKKLTLIHLESLENDYVWLRYKL